MHLFYIASMASNLRTVSRSRWENSRISSYKWYYSLAANQKGRKNGIDNTVLRDSRLLRRL